MSETPRERVDWDALQPHYEAGIRTLKALGEEFGCSNAAIVQHAKRRGWSRCLKGKIQAKADAKVAAALVAQEHKDSPAGRLTEAIRVEVESEVQARIRIEHRSDISRAKRIVNRLFERMETLEFSEEGSIVEVKEHANTAAKLVDAQHKLIALEREAYGIDQMAPPPKDDLPVDITEGARRLAFILAGADSHLSRQVH